MGFRLYAGASMTSATSEQSVPAAAEDGHERCVVDTVRALALEVGGERAASAVILVAAGPERSRESAEEHGRDH